MICTPPMTLTMRVNSVTWEIDLVHVYELRALGGGELPPFTAGAYVVVQLDNKSCPTRRLHERLPDSN